MACKNVNFPKAMFFNLPKGSYTPLNDIKQTIKPVFYHKPKLYKREKKKALKRAKIVFKEN